jgi:two-component system LytT family sensor kinase
MLHQLTEAELRALRAQINPHFLFNALNMLAELIRTAPEKAEEVTLRLSNVFRHVLRNSEKNVCQIQEEIDFLRAYLSIEEARLEENLHVDIQLDPQIAHEHIPSLLLQPIVENAIRHGLAPKLGPGRLEIVARGEEDAIILLVGDDGIGTPLPQDTITHSYVSANGGTGVGLKNTLERLRTFYKGEATLSFHSVPDAGSQVIIRIPRTVNL